MTMTAMERLLEESVPVSSVPGPRPPWTQAEQDEHWAALCEAIGVKSERPPHPAPEPVEVPPVPVGNPLRVRLAYGRKTHAARDIGRGDRVTACNYYLPADHTGTHDWRSPVATVTCRECRPHTARR